MESLEFTGVCVGSYPSDFSNAGIHSARKLSSRARSPLRGLPVGVAPMSEHPDEQGNYQAKENTQHEKY